MEVGLAEIIVANRQKHAASMSLLAGEKSEMEMEIRNTGDSIGGDMLSGEGVPYNIRLKDYGGKGDLCCFSSHVVRLSIIGSQLVQFSLWLRLLPALAFTNFF